MKNILITGANGQLGNEFRQLASHYPEYNFIFTDRAELDITNLDAVEAFFHQQTIDYCINCAAYTAVDKAESEEAIATAINATAVRYLAQMSAMQNCPFIQISTDYVYHNGQNTPFKEDDVVNPQGIYAKTKLQGEYFAFEQNTRAVVVRTSWVYSTFGHNFVKTMLRLGAERPSLSVVFDQIGTPTYAQDLAAAILKMIQHVEKEALNWEELSGVYNYSNEGVTSWYDFAKAIFDIRGINCNLQAIESSQFPTPAQRPPFSLMNKQLIKDSFELDIPYWRDSLIKMLAQLG